jgi:hypothetical protein
MPEHQQSCVTRGGIVSEAGNNENAQMPPSSSSGGRQDEKLYFNYSATLRIFGSIPDFDEITQSLGVTPSKTHRKGDRVWPRGQSPKLYEHDMWAYEAPVKETEPLHVHIDTLWHVFRERRDYLLKLKQTVKVDVFLGYRSNCDRAGIEVPYQSLDIFRELQVPFGLSIIVV